MKFENTKVFNFEGAIRGARNPMESWAKSDSVFDIPPRSKEVIGLNDLGLMQRLLGASIHDKNSSHSKFMRQIFVCVDITAPLYWWKEFDTYKVGTTANSTSTMHRLTSKPITLDCFEPNDDSLVSYLEDGDKGFTFFSSDEELSIIDWLESLRLKYIETKDKRYWKKLVCWLPESWLQTRTITMSYENIRNMYFQRRNHKLTEWSVVFTDWVKTLPYAEELIMYEG